jgi:hypothetical protein
MELVFGACGGFCQHKTWKWFSLPVGGLCEQMTWNWFSPPVGGCVST